MKAPLYNGLKEYFQLNRTSFHMPGHKKRNRLPYEELVKFDITEVEGLDNLHGANGIIQEAQQRASKLYNSIESHFLVNGSTVGILASIMGLTNKGDKILVARNCHKAVYHAIILNELEPVYIEPDIIKEYAIAGSIKPEEVERLVAKHTEITLAIITSPTYEGIVSDIKSIVGHLHKKGIPLIVDEAHGAHFRFHEAFPISALELGADVVIHSLHKTMPSLTQTALLHINNHTINHHKIKEYLRMLQTSSPSYILMASIDYCLGLIEEQGDRLFDTFIKNLMAFRETLSHNLKVIKLLNKVDRSSEEIFELDKSKILLNVGDTNVSGCGFEKLLREEANIQMELSNQQYVLGITTVSDTLDELESLSKVIINYDRQFKIVRKSTDIISKRVITQCLTPFEARKKPYKSVPIQQSAGKISAEFLIPYPPGIPLLVPGELITEDIIEGMEGYKKLGISIIGLTDLTLEKINIINEV